MKKLFFIITLFFIFLSDFSISIGQTKKLFANNISSPKKVYVVDSVALFSFIQDKENELKIEAYFKERSMPLYDKASKFIEVAKKYQLDPFLLPSIAINESTGGKFLFKSFNPFGFGKKTFSSFEEAIEYVGDKLANGTHYKGKTLEKKLATYNSVKKRYTTSTFKNMKNMKNQKIQNIDPMIFVDSFRVEYSPELEEIKM